MAFTVPEIVKTVEYRGLNTGVSGNGNSWMSMKVEYTTNSGSTIDWEINVPKDLQGSVYNVGMQKGDYLNIEFVAKNGRSQAGRDYGYLQLEKVPQIVEFDEDGVIS